MLSLTVSYLQTHLEKPVMYHVPKGGGGKQAKRDTGGQPDKEELIER